ncbi:MAG: HAMP domain-containing sensor histidine kinase [Pseudomonadota bacterium]|nr:HAMP domain-containing sensor histidine kinase [Pseudomonadota bacterium]
MSTGEPPTGPAREKTGLIERFRADLARDGINPWTASFQDAAMEQNYREHLYGVELPRLRMFCAMGLVVWFSFSILDVLTISDGLKEVLTLRWLIAGPIALLINIAIRSERLKQYYGWLIAAGIFTISLAIICMIAAMPAQGSPPYIIGVLVIFAYTSCFIRFDFRIAAALFGVTAALYCAMLATTGKFSSVEIISGYFFMINIANIAILTHYAQEIASRQIWRRNRQRALDAAYIEELLIEATAADQSKLNFISILSHELRTPLHQIIGFTEIVMQRFADGENARTEEFLGDIRTSAHDLLSRIAKMLRYADATAGKIKYDREHTPTRDLIETVLTQSKSLALSKAIEFDAEGVVDASIWVDHPHTAYAIGHILENAIKASKRGARVVLRGDVAGDGGYILQIEDAGIGMTAEQIKGAFEPFSQVEQVRTRALDGIGLGLTLARKIFQDQGAELFISSVKGEGTTVSVHFSPTPPEAERRADIA